MNKSTSYGVSPVKARFFYFCMLFFGIVALITVAVNLLLGFAFYLNYKWLGLAAATFGLAWLARRATRLDIVHRVGVYLFAFVMLPLGWLSSSGLVSPSITYSFLVLLMINYLISGRERLIVNMLFIVLNLVLIALFYYRPQLFTAMTAREQFLDWMANVPLVLTALAVALTQFERAYERERMRNEDKARELEELSVTDYLTGLFNRLRLEEALRAAESGYARTGSPYSLLLLDIDHFKPYNDYYGHVAGDGCLKQVAEAIRRSLERDSDIAFRYGGEEFLVLIQYTDCAGACTVAERIRTAVEELAIPHQTSPTAPVLTVSIGVACSDGRVHKPDTQRDGGRLLSAVDSALYRAKSKGRNRIVVYEPSEVVS